MSLSHPPQFRMAHASHRCAPADTAASPAEATDWRGLSARLAAAHALRRLLMSEASEALPTTEAGGCFHAAAARAIADYVATARSDGSFCAQDAENSYLDVNLVISTNGKAGGRNSNLEAGTSTAGGRGLK